MQLRKGFGYSYMEKQQKVVYTEDELRKITAYYKKLSDDQLLDIIREKNRELGRLPNRADVPASGYFKSRFGPWPRVLEAAGVKPVSEVYARRVEARKAKHRAKRQREWEIREAKRQAKKTGCAESEENGPCDESNKGDNA